MYKIQTSWQYIFTTAVTFTSNNYLYMYTTHHLITNSINLVHPIKIYLLIITSNSNWGTEGKTINHKKCYEGLSSKLLKRPLARDAPPLPLVASWVSVCPGTLMFLPVEKWSNGWSKKTLSDYNYNPEFACMKVTLFATSVKNLSYTSQTFTSKPGVKQKQKKQKKCNDSEYILFIWRTATEEEADWKRKSPSSPSSSIL